MFCPRTQQQCYNPECGKTTGICDPSQPINYSTAVYAEEYVKQLLSTIEEKDKEIEFLNKNCDNLNEVINDCGKEIERLKGLMEREIKKGFRAVARVTKTGDQITEEWINNNYEYFKAENNL